MKFGIRCAVDFNNIKGRLSELQGVPIELALPYRVDDYLERRAKMAGRSTIKKCVKR
jgi:hypothetical protein